MGICFNKSTTHYTVIWSSSFFLNISISRNNLLISVSNFSVSICCAAVGNWIIANMNWRQIVCRRISLKPKEFIYTHAHSDSSLHTFRSSSKLNSMAGSSDDSSILERSLIIWFQFLNWIHLVDLIRTYGTSWTSNFKLLRVGSTEVKSFGLKISK